MPLLVKMHAYSGRPDPQWVIGGDSERELRRLAASGAAGISPHNLSRLGYRGFTVMETSGDIEPRPLFLVRSRTGSPTPSHAITGIPELEEFLLWTGHEHLSDSLATHARQNLGRITPAVGAGNGCPDCVAQDAPAYNPDWWNTLPRRLYNNCYAYANNQATDTFPQPGRAGGDPIRSLDCAGVRPAAESDGLAACANFTAPLTEGEGWYVALVIWPQEDYHWYRQDNSGCWSHKPGETEATNLDNSGNQITDPRTCDRGEYTVFCTFMITNSEVEIQ
jgi:hypothetical protein